MSLFSVSFLLKWMSSSTKILSTSPLWVHLSGSSRWSVRLLISAEVRISQFKGSSPESASELNKLWTDSVDSHHLLSSPYQFLTFGCMRWYKLGCVFTLSSILLKLVFSYTFNLLPSSKIMYFFIFSLFQELMPQDKKTFCCHFSRLRGRKKYECREV